uniref:Cytochrome P450, family 2, subfamily AD, polypeptide 2 n=1 Tax=Esox lucius TaxID=8010 RepID=A0A3P8Y327_ESOLU
MILQAVLDFFDVKGCLVFIFVFLLVMDIIRNRPPPNFPPGPWSLPFLGNIFTKLDFKSMDKMAEDYGPVYSLRRGNERIVFISGYKMVKEALVHQLNSFADRPINPLFHVIFKGIGIVLSNGYMWKNQRKFANTHLRSFGEGKKGLEHYIQLESNFLCEAFREEQGRGFNPHFILNNAVGNIISSVVFGHRFEYSDENFQKVLRLDNEAVILSGSALAQLYDVFPGILKYLPGPHQTIHSNYYQIIDILQVEIDKHKEDWDPENPRDYVDMYLTEINKMKEDPKAGFNTESLIICTLELLEAGTESVATTLRWALVYMMIYPEIQEKVQAEIDRVIGQSRQPNMSDRPNMPYTDAVIHEIQRIGNIVPLGFPKMSSKDTTLGGYFIPKGTTITTNLSSVLFDNNEWESPNTFNPDHFLDSDGQFRKREAFLPFSAGKRVCLGENLARMELFLFFTTLVQRFSFSPVPGALPSLKGVLGFTHSPENFLICKISNQC